MTAARLGWLCVWLLAAAAIVGCQPRCPETQLALDELVAAHNTNAAAIGRLWARARIHLTIGYDEHKTFNWGSASLLAAPNGLLLLHKADDPLGPQDFVLLGREVGQDIFRLGSSVDEGVYYLWYRHGRGGRAWFGRHEFAGAPGVQSLQIDPNQLASVLSICSLPTDFTKIPTVAMSMSSQPCAYVLTYIDHQPITNRIIFKREIYLTWSDDQPARPFLINLFDDAGRRVMTAHLKDYKPVKTAEPHDTPPVMPTDIDITWPQNKSRVHIVLSEMTIEDKWSVEACRFKDSDGELPNGIPASSVTQVDAFLESGGRQR